MSKAARLVKIIDQISKWTGMFSTYLCLVLLGVMMFEVIARYVFNAPTIWAVELSSFIFFGIWLFAGGLALQRDAHVRLDILYTRLSKRGRAIADVITAPIFFIMVGIIVFISFKYALRSISISEYSGSNWAPPIYIIKTLIPIGAFFVLLQGVAKLIVNVYMVFRSKELE